MRLLLLAGAFFVIFSGAARAADDSRQWASPTVPETLLLAASEALIAVDVLQTLDMNRHLDRFGNRYTEINPLLGHHPSNTRIMLSGAAGGLVVAASWYILPPKIRWVVPSLVMIAEAVTIADNARVGLSLSF